MPTETPTAQAARRTAATARWAVLAGLPGLALTALAAAGSTSLVMRTDLLLSALDMTALTAVWVLAAARLHGRAVTGPAEALVAGLVAACMMASMVAVSAAAAGRLLAGMPAPQGAGLWLGLGLNLASAGLNLWLLLRWRARLRAAPSPLARSQVRLFADKLCSNLLIAGSVGATLALGARPSAAMIDPLASLALAAVSAYWTLPVVGDALRLLLAAFAPARHPAA